MKTILLFAALLVAPAAAVMAQAPAPLATQATPQRQRHGNPHKAALRMGQQLGLSADQQARLEPILTQRQQKADGIRANTQLSDAERRGQLKAVHRESRAEMKQVLTTDQMRQMKAMHHARHAATTPTPGV